MKPDASGARERQVSSMNKQKKGGGCALRGGSRGPNRREEEPQNRCCEILQEFSPPIAKEISKNITGAEERGVDRDKGKEESRN